MVTWVPGYSDCTASASTWAVSWRISASASGSRRVTKATAASRSIGRDRSTSSPSSCMARAARARPGPIDAASSVPVTGASKRRTEPSGRVMAGMYRASSFAGSVEWTSGRAAATLATGRSARSVAASTVTWPRGRVSAGSLSAENSATVGTPSAAARWVGPVSLPTASAARAQTPPNWSRLVRPVRSIASGQAAQHRVGVRGVGGGAHHHGGQSPCANDAARAPNRSAGQRLRGRCGAAPGTEHGVGPRQRPARVGRQPIGFGGGEAGDAGHAPTARAGAPACASRRGPGWRAGSGSPARCPTRAAGRPGGSTSRSGRRFAGRTPGRTRAAPGAAAAARAAATAAAWCR